MPADSRRIKELFGAAIELPIADRAAYLDRECGDDAELRQRLDSLLQAHDDPASALNQPLAGTPTGSYAQSPQGLESGSIFAGRYKLREQLGEGGMGVVYVADQSEPVQRRVALKIIRANLPTEALLARFEQERQALALMDHPNIAKVYDAGVFESPPPPPSPIEGEGEKRISGSLPPRGGGLGWGGTPYFVMELIKGLPITKYCDDAKLTPKQRLELFIPVCQAVQHAHQKGIIHRDLKPANIIVGLYDGRPVPKVIDFGVAKMTGPRLTEHSVYTEVGSIIGTLEYMSPEQAELNNLDIDTRTDIYALGVILYELLTGTVPVSRKELQSAGFAAMLQAIKEKEPSKPSTKLSGSGSLPSIAACRQTDPAKLTKLIRGDLDWIVMKALEKDRTRRYETANGFAADVNRYLCGEAVLAHPPSAGYRMKKFLRKNKGPVIAASLVALALVGGIAATSWQAHRAELARQDALVAAAGERRAREEAETAAAAEKAAREQTQKRLAQIERGVELFAGMLTGINPKAEEQGGPPLYAQLRERAEKAADELSAESVGDPLAVARLQTILGDTLRELGNAAKAAEVLEKARATRERDLGADHPDTLNTLHNLAGAYRAAGKLPEAIALYEQVRDALVKKQGADHPDTLNTLHNLAGAYRAAGKYPEAIALHERVRDALVKKLGADHPNTLAALNNLAVVYRAVGKLPEVIALLEQVRDAQVKKLGADHPDTLTTLHNLAGAYQAAGKLSEAIALHQQVRDARVKKLGADHPDTLVTLTSLAVAYRAAGKLPEAIALLEQVRDALVKKLGADHPDTLATLNNLATAYLFTGKLAEAIALFVHVRDAQVKKLGADHPDTLVTLHNLAGAYKAAGKLPEALKLCEEVLSARKRVLPAGHQGIGATIFGIARVHSLMIPKADDKSKQADLAMDWLMQAVAAGFKDAAHIKKNKDLDPLRDREDFKKLIVELEAKAAAEKKEEKK